MKVFSGHILPVAILMTHGLLAASSSHAQGLPDDPFAPVQNIVAPSEDQQRAAEEELKRSALNAAIDSTMPLAPDQIKEILSRMSDVQRAAAPPIGDPSKPKARLKSDEVSLSPGSTPPVVKVASGYVTTILFSDATGSPWPIVDMAFSGKFDVKPVKDNPSSLRITPLIRFQEGNISLQMAGLDAPVILRVVSEVDEVYFRHDIRIPGLGPNAASLSMSATSTITAGNSDLIAFLDGYPPSGARRFKVMGADDRTAAWGMGGEVYLRTPLSLLSPAWSNSVRSGDGTTVYVIPETPVILLSDQGIMTRVRLDKPEGVAKGDLLNDN